MKYLKYLWYVIKHKWFVMIECWKNGLIWRGIVHDISKFYPSEFFPYARHFCGNIKKGRDKTGYYKPTNTGDPGFDKAWFLHQKRNDHHWQWWIMPDEALDFKTKTLEDKTSIKECPFCESFWPLWKSLESTNLSEVKVFPMPMVCRIEMICDWKGAGRAQGTPDTVAWYNKNGDKMIIHNITRLWIENRLGLLSDEVYAEKMKILKLKG